jgi:hypothetical protein
MNDPATEYENMRLTDGRRFLVSPPGGSPLQGNAPPTEYTNVRITDGKRFIDALFAGMPNLGGDGGAPGSAVWGDITGSITNQTDLQNALNAKADTDDVLLIGGNASTSTLSFGATTAQTVQIMSNGNPYVVIDSIGNVGIGVTNPMAPLAVAGAITVEAGSVQTEWNPTSGTELSAGTVSNHPYQLIANGTTNLTLTGTQITSSVPLHMSEQKVVNLADGTDPRDAVNRQQLDTKLNTTGGTINGTLTISSTSNTPFVVTTDSASTFADFVFRNTRAASTSNQMNWYTTLRNDASANIRSLQITTQLSAITAGAESSTATFSTYRAGVQAQRLSITSNVNIFLPLHMQTNKITNLADGTDGTDAVNLTQLNSRLTAAQRTAIDALVPATATTEDIVNALQAS